VYHTITDLDTLNLQPCHDSPKLFSKDFVGGFWLKRLTSVSKQGKAGG